MYISESNKFEGGAGLDDYFVSYFGCYSSYCYGAVIGTGSTV